MKYKNSIKNWAKDDRPREKFLLKGRKALSDAELLAILLGSGSKDESAVDLAKHILAEVGNNLVELSRLDITSLKKFKGIGTVKSITIAAALELGRRRREADALDKKSINSSKDAFEYLQAELSDKNYEEFWMVNLNSANRIINKVLISEGGIGQSVVDLRKIFKAALESNAVSIVLAHNHPSGNTKPSKSDIDVTQKIRNAAALLNISLLDHIILGDEKYLSFADQGIL
ncbi:MAG: DNA repair protein RadC [Bacteroidales bacterium]|nr:DNA repair protein RadC [Bacteroidales bacterium]